MTAGNGDDVAPSGSKRYFEVSGDNAIRGARIPQRLRCLLIEISVVFRVRAPSHTSSNASNRDMPVRIIEQPRYESLDHGDAVESGHQQPRRERRPRSTRTSALNSSERTLSSSEFVFRDVRLDNVC